MSGPLLLDCWTKSLYDLSEKRERKKSHAEAVEVP